MKTLMQEVYENFNTMSDADFKSWMLNTDLLEKEREVTCKFARKYDLELGDGIMRSVEDCFDETYGSDG